VSVNLTGLTTGTLYTSSVTAIDTSCNESAGSAPASGVAQIDFAVSPTGPVNFGSVNLGSFADQTFTVQNTGGGRLSGTVSTLAPFVVVSGDRPNARLQGLADHHHGPGMAGRPRQQLRSAPQLGQFQARRSLSLLRELKHSDIQLRSYLRITYSLRTVPRP